MSFKLSGVIKFINTLSEYQWRNVNFLADELEVTRRTIFRYVREIEDAFDPYPMIEHSRDGYRLCRHDFVESLQRLDDFAGLSAAMTGPLGSLLASPAAGGEKIRKIVAETIDAHKSIPAKQARVLVDAMRDGEYLDINYRKSTDLELRKIVPIKLFFDYGLGYIVSYDDEYEHLILLSIEKIEDIRKTKRNLDPAMLKELRDYVKSAWGKMIRHSQNETTEVTFDVSPSIAPYFIRSPLHNSQRSTEVDYGYRITLVVHNETELVRFLLRFGQAVRIIGPKSTLEELHDFLSGCKTTTKKAINENHHPSGNPRNRRELYRSEIPLG